MAQRLLNNTTYDLRSRLVMGTDCTNDFKQVTRSITGIKANYTVKQKVVFTKIHVCVQSQDVFVLTLNYGT